MTGYILVSTNFFYLMLIEAIAAGIFGMVMLIAYVEMRRKK